MTLKTCPVWYEIIKAFPCYSRMVFLVTKGPKMPRWPTSSFWNSQRSFSYFLSEERGFTLARGGIELAWCKYYSLILYPFLLIYNFFNWYYLFMNLSDQLDNYNKWLVVSKKILKQNILPTLRHHMKFKVYTMKFVSFLRDAI